MIRLLFFVFLSFSLRGNAAAVDLRFTDSGFSPEVLRRLHIRLLGTLPPPDVVKEVNDNTVYNDFADHLISSPDYVDALTGYWTGLLAITKTEDIEWMRQQVALNTPVDQRLYGWFRTRESTVSTDTEAFERAKILGPSLFGESLNCIQCHDHAYRRSRTRDFYGLAGFFKPEGFVMRPEDLFGPDRGLPRSAATPAWIEPYIEVHSERQLERIVAKNRDMGNQRALHDFAEWLTDFRYNKFSEYAIVARYLSHFTGNPNWRSMAENDYILEEARTTLGPWVQRFRNHRYNEKELIRAIVTHPRFVNFPANPDFAMPSKRDADEWKHAVFQILNIEDREALSGINTGTTIQKHLFLDKLFAEGNQSAELSPEFVFLSSLSRAPTEEESASLRDADLSGLCHALFLSDEFCRIP